MSIYNGVSEENHNMELKSVKLGLDLGSKFLTAQSAYFLGLLLADERTKINNKVFWQAPVRHNPTHFNYHDLEEHYNFIKEIAEFLGKDGVSQLTDFFKEQGIPISKFTAGKKGIVTLFEQINDGYDVSNLINDILEPLRNSADLVKRAFLVGVFDGRGSYDKTAKFIALDYDSNDVREIVAIILNELGIDANINSKASARIRKDSTSAPRKKQIRIKHIEYLKNIGFISPTRFEKATVELPVGYETISLGEILPGLKAIQSNQRSLF